MKSEDAVIGREGPEESQPLGKRPSGTAFLSNPSPPTRARPAANWPIPFPLHSHHPQHPPSQVLWVQGPSSILPQPRPSSNTLFGAWRGLPDTPADFRGSQSKPWTHHCRPTTALQRGTYWGILPGALRCWEMLPSAPKASKATEWEGEAGEQFNRSHCSR